jgi:hypothetical protein
VRSVRGYVVSAGKGRQTNKKNKGRRKVLWSKWSQREDVYSQEDGVNAPDKPLSHYFKKGGVLKIHLNKLSVEQRNALLNELLQTKFFHVYKLRGGPEPTYQFLVHEQSGEVAFYDDLSAEQLDKLKTAFKKGKLDKVNEQPVYKYARNVSLKSRPKDDNRVEMKRLFEETKHYPEDGINTIDLDNLEDFDDFILWNIGAHVVLYRDDDDYMGFHADHDQEEELIMTVIVASPKSKDTKGNLVEKAR